MPKMQTVRGRGEGRQVGTCIRGAVFEQKFPAATFQTFKQGNLKNVAFYIQFSSYRKVPGKCDHLSLQQLTKWEHAHWMFFHG
jgi:hypothetical protein